MKTSELIGPALDYAAGVALGHDMSKAVSYGTYLRIPAHAGSAYTVTFCPSTDWTVGGPIIERERIGVWHYQQKDWMASWWKDGRQAFGPTPLIAAMRCFVASRLGESVDIPEELRGE
jgi:hypothetical protein